MPMDGLHTGDKGEFDNEGYLKITGRIKDAFKTSKGKYVSPTKIEAHFEVNELVEQVCVMGTNMPQPIALVVPSEAACKLPDTDFTSQMNDLLVSINSLIENYERMSHVVIIKDEWSIDSGLLTPTLKLKRNVVEDLYSKYLNQWSSDKSVKVVRS
jgi:long-chain acyl-CoA synthetase